MRWDVLIGAALSIGAGLWTLVIRTWRAGMAFQALQDGVAQLTSRVAELSDRIARLPCQTGKGCEQ